MNHSIPGPADDLIEQIRKRVAVLWPRLADPKVQRALVLARAEKDLRRWTVPGELSAAIRAQPGAPIPIRLTVKGKAVTVAIHPTGEIDPEREAAVWSCIRRRVRLQEVA